MAKYSILFKSLLFWIIFTLLNVVLNTPEWINQLLQSDYLSNGNSLTSPINLFNAPQKGVLLNVFGEIVLLLFPLLLFGQYRLFKRIYVPLASIVFLLILYYNIYLAVYLNLYSVHPIFENDWIIVKEILPTFLNELSVQKGSYLIVLFGVLLSSLLLFLLHYYWQTVLIRHTIQPVFWAISLGLISLFGIYQQQFSKDNFLFEENKSSNENIFNWVYPNIQKSRSLNRKDPLIHLKKRWIYDVYLNKPLVKKKPNIYLLFIESYGGVATLTEYCSQPFAQLSEQLESQLKSADWHISSNYSKSTVIGGRSWLAMTTAMTGARIEDQIQYNGLLNEHQTYPHMIAYFNKQGYETVRVSTMSSNKIDTMQMITIPNLFWGFDQRYMYSDIPYKGYKYDYYGGIPDQYTLGHIQEAILDKAERPYFMTFITMNSHGPWSNAPPIVENWRTMDTLQNPFPNGRPKLGMDISQYWELMEFELKLLTKFILENGEEDSVFILLGDHNPAGLEWKLKGRFNKWATPIHIISKDKKFVDSFHQHGFTEGMQVDTSKFTIMRHMGLYSILTRQLLENYGEKEVVLPEYLPWGLDLAK